MTHDYKYSRVRYMVGKCNGDRVEYIVSDSLGNLGEVDFKIDLSTGKYYLYCEIDWLDTPLEYVIASYGVGEVKFKVINDTYDKA